MEGEKPGQKEDGKGWISVPSQAAPQEFLGIPFWKQLSIGVASPWAWVSGG